MRRIAAFIFLTITGLLQACVTPEMSLKQGIQPTYESFVPARIAVLSCLNWPNSLRYQGQALSNIVESEQQTLCAELNKFVIGGFKDQPFMRGYSPKAVAKLLQNVKQDDMLDKLPRLWNAPIDKCENCINAPTMYERRLSMRPEWRLWLNEFSRSTRFSDAILIPFITHAYRQTADDRGLTVAKTSVGVQLLLIDTNTAKLIWAGGRETFATEQSLPDRPKAKELKPPGLDRVMRQLLVDDIWREFPGRQFL